MRNSNILFTTIVLITMCGCAMFQNINPTYQIVLIKAAARTGTYLGLQEEIDDVEERKKVARLLRDDITENVLSLLEDNNVEISAENRELLLAKLPIELRPFLGDALEILDDYMRQANLGDYLDANAVRILRAFFSGVVEGCDLFLTRVGESYGMGNNSRISTEECLERR